MSRRRGLRRLALCVLSVVCLAPTPGDIGGCGQVVQDLDAVVFFEQKRELDCQACAECGLTTRRCAEACADFAEIEPEFPEGCFPLVHDGEVCLRALRYSTCDEYQAFVSDGAVVVPTECDFCPGERP